MNSGKDGQKDQKAKTIEHYEEFFSLWKDADLGIAEVDAKKRLALLKAIHKA